MSIFKINYERNLSGLADTAIVEAKNFEQAKQIFENNIKNELGKFINIDIINIEKTDWKLFVK